MPNAAEGAAPRVPSYHDACDPATYDDALAAKASSLATRFAPLLARDDDDDDAVMPEVFASPRSHFRSRCRFQVARAEGADGALSYRMWDGGKPSVIVSTFPMALRRVNEVMRLLLGALRESRLDAAAAGGGGGCDDDVLTTGLEAAHFLAARSARGGVLVTLVYSSPIDAARWVPAATALRTRLASALERSSPAAADEEDESPPPLHLLSEDESARLRVNVLGRSKGVALSARVVPVPGAAGDASPSPSRPGETYVVETLRLDDGDAFAYKHAEGAFSNPNAWMAEHTLTWLRSCARAIAAERGGAGASLLELYCGCGNHTVALAGMFTRVVAVEISEELCDAARDNLRRNGIEEGVSIVHAPSASVSRELLRGGGGGLGLGLDAFNVVLVDPPRAGLDADTLALVKRFEYVLYISCDPASLARDAMGGEEGNGNGKGGGTLRLSDTHDVVKFAVFDHFPYTRHAEVGACFARRRPDGRSRRSL